MEGTIEWEGIHRLPLFYSMAKLLQEYSFDIFSFRHKS
jgi:hypothetical protein